MSFRHLNTRSPDDGDHLERIRGHGLDGGSMLLGAALRIQKPHIISSELSLSLFLYNLGCPGTHSVDQAGLELRNLPDSASQVLGLKACTTTARLSWLSLLVCELLAATSNTSS